MIYESWGRYPKLNSKAKRIFWRTENLPSDYGTSMLPFGRGRSYGDCCLNDEGLLIDTSRLDHFIEFDNTNGILRCEAGVTLDQILRLIVPQGWFIPVTPGTKYVTVGGAIANDVHGKNHHYAGTFGRHVLSFELLRSSGDRIICSPDNNAELFKATISGMGLTGLILWAEIRLKRINNPFICMETLRFKNLDDFFDVAEQSEQGYEYTVAWVDCLSKGRHLGKGLFMRGNHATALTSAGILPKSRNVSIPFDFPEVILNKATIKLFNFLYYHRQSSERKEHLTYYDPFFYPLDFIQQWNRMYGKDGFLQYQCVVPYQDHRTIHSIMTYISKSGMGSFLTVLKTFGDIQSPGMLSFPRKGVTLALDFPYRGSKTLDLLDRLDEIVRDNGGAVYPAKDARMSPESFYRFFPRWEEFSKFIDPNFSSTLWRRVTHGSHISQRYKR